MLSVKNLSISFNSNTEQNKVVHNVSFELKQQQIIGIVGEETIKVYSKALFEEPIDVKLVEQEMLALLEEGDDEDEDN